MAVSVLAAVPETLPPARRHSGGLRAFARAGREVLRNRRYVGYLVVSGAAMGALFAYVATSAFVLQSMNGLSPIGYSVDFAANAGGMTVAALVAARLAGRVPTRAVVLVGQLAALASGVALLVGALWFGTPLALVVVCFFVLMSAQGLIGGNGGRSPPPRSPSTPGPAPRSSASSSGSPPAPSPRSPASAASGPPSPWPPWSSPASPRPSSASCWPGRGRTDLRRQPSAVRLSCWSW